MEAGNWIGLAGLIATTIMAVVTLVINRINHREEMKRSDERHAQELRRQSEEINRMERIMELERRFKPHIEFCLAANFLGPQNGAYAAEILIEVKNKGNIQQKITSMRLRIRGIKHSDKLEFWERYPKRLRFPEELLEAPVIDQDYGYYFVEPGVDQVISFTTIVPEAFRFIVVWAEFRYGETRKRGEGARHSAERVFEVKAG